MTVGEHLRAAFTKDLGLKTLALVLATLAFLYSHGEENQETTFVVPVEYLFPADLVLLNEDPLPEQVVIVASGSRTAISRAASLNLRYVVDLEKAVAGTTEYSFRQPPSGFPQRLRISTVSPAMIKFRFDEQDRRSVPVQLRVRGELPPGFVETERTVEPSEVVLVGARSQLAELSAIPTTPLRLENRTKGFDGELALDTTGLRLLPESAQGVSVSLVVEEVVADREFGAVAAGLSKALSARPGLALEPKAVVVRLRGPVPVLERLRSESLRLEVGGPIEALPAEGEGTRIKWAAGPRPADALGVVLRIDHPRSERLEVLEVAPGEFLLRNEGVPADDDAAPGDTPPDGGGGEQ